MAAHSDYFKANFFSTLVRAFYSRVTYRLGGPIISTGRGFEIQLDLERICIILDIPPVGLRVYESKAWPIVSGFELREAIQRMCGLADTQGMDKPFDRDQSSPSPHDLLHPTATRRAPR